MHIKSLNSKKHLSNIPTHILMGFLGTGKTSAILSLLNQKPEQEHWAVLVNEFGKVGIDGAIYAAHGISVKEVPGGCMCCSQGATMQVAVNHLLKDARPDRLLVESSGIGHPSGLLKTFSQEHFKGVLNMKASICLIDPARLSEPRYYQNPLFREQMAIADVLIANKVDVSSPQHLDRFHKISNSFKIKKSYIGETSFGHIDIEVLFSDVAIRQVEDGQFSDSCDIQTSSLATCGWIIDETEKFSLERLLVWFEQLDVERAKGLFTTGKGRVLINKTNGRVEHRQLEFKGDSRIDILADKLDCDDMKTSLNNCLL